MKFPLGTGPQGPLLCDLDRLVDTRLLVQANSGGGKSWLLRRLLEQTHGRVQHLVIDPEGEFASLREKYDYVLAAPRGGDTLAEPRSAALLAERLLELRVSAVLDIYELKHHDRIRFVRLFLDALVNAPKKLWHPALVVVDEVHVYCPEKGEAESASAVIDLATRGRKRGFCAVLASQRLAKVSKDAAAECNNVMIGRTGLDVDVKRAADVLGFAKDRWRELRELAPGQFFTFGPALAPAVVAVQVGPVETTHPKAGARLAFTAPQPTATIRALLPKLADLPAEAAERQRTTEDLRREVQRLTAELARAQHAAPAPTVREVPVIGAPELQRLEACLASAERLLDKRRETLETMRTALLNAAVGHETTLHEALATAKAMLKKVHTLPRRGPEPSGPGPRTPLPPRPAPLVGRLAPADRRIADQLARAGENLAMGLGADGLGEDYRTRVLTVIATLYARGIPVAQRTVAAWLRVHRNNGSLCTTLAQLRAEGIIHGWTPNGTMQPPALAPGWEPVWPLLTDYERKVARTAIDAGPDYPTNAALAGKLGVHRNNGSLCEALAHLRAMGLFTARGPIAPMEALFR